MTTERLLRIEVTCKGITPLLINRVTEEVLLKIRDRIKDPKTAPRGTPREEAAKKLYCDESRKQFFLPPQMLYSALVSAGVYVRLEGKRQVSTAKSTALPSFMSLEDSQLNLKTPGWEPDIRQGRNPNGGELVVVCRPRFDMWEFCVRIAVDTRVIAEEKIRELFDLAGRRCGLGDFRPNRKGIYGQFVVECWKLLV